MDLKNCEHCGNSLKFGVRFCSYACAWAAKKVPAIKRFLQSIELAGEEECWPWIKTRDRDGYGKFSDDAGRDIRAHRFSYEYYVGKIPNGLSACHSCDNPPCVNWRHIYLGTVQKNTQDAVTRGLINRVGDRSHAKKISSDIVTRIRLDYAGGKVSQSALAIKYGLSQPHISDILAGGSWPTIGGPLIKSLPRKILSSDTVQEIRRLYSLGEQQLVIAKRFNLTKGCIFNIVHKNTWSHV